VRGLDPGGVLVLGRDPALLEGLEQFFLLALGQEDL
jgi:hypothetical protein